MKRVSSRPPITPPRSSKARPRDAARPREDAASCEAVAANSNGTAPHGTAPHGTASHGAALNGSASPGVSYKGAVGAATPAMAGTEIAARAAEYFSSPHPNSSFDSREGDELFRSWREGGDEGARERLILSHRNLVHYLARRFSQNGEMFDDVVQVGMLGLIRALDSFDPSRGLRFSTFATPSIAGEIRRYFRDKAGSVRLPRRLQELQVAISQRIETLTHQLDRCPTYAEIGRAMGLEAEEVAEVVELAHTLDIASLDDPAHGDGEGFETLTDQIGAPDPRLAEWSEHAALEAALEKLAPESRRVLEMAYFDGRSQVEIAKQLGVSQMQVSRVQRRALVELRKLLDEV